VSYVVIHNTAYWPVSAEYHGLKATKTNTSKDSNMIGVS
jgi:hypothetical protein